jgi:outer membrane lipoprotein SlyB
MTKQIKTVVLSTITVLLLSGCAGSSYTKVGTTITGDKLVLTKKDVHARTRMSETIFLEPVAPEDQIIYFRFRNTSDEELNVITKLKIAFEKKGFTVTRNPKKANFIVQANLLKIGKMDLNEQKNYLGSGFGGGLALGGVTALTGGSGRSVGKMAVAGALLGIAHEAMSVKDVYYAMITDVEIRQRPLEGETVTQTGKFQADMGRNGSTRQTSKNTNVKWKKYRTRIISSAYAAGLDFEQAQPFLEDGMIRTLGGTM